MKNKQNKSVGTGVCRSISYMLSDRKYVILHRKHSSCCESSASRHLIEVIVLFEKHSSVSLNINTRFYTQWKRCRRLMMLQNNGVRMESDCPALWCRLCVGQSEPKCVKEPISVPLRRVWWHLTDRLKCERFPAEPWQNNKLSCVSRQRPHMNV